MRWSGAQGGTGRGGAGRAGQLGQGEAGHGQPGRGGDFPSPAGLLYSMQAGVHVTFCVWLVVMAGILVPLSWLGTPKDFW